MSRNTVVYTLVALFFLAAGSVLQASEGWLTDYEAAKKQAAKEGKDILMDFTGSDWCPPCMNLNKNVFSKEAFKKDAQKHFVLLELDFPKTKKLEAKLKAQNEKLRDEFGIDGYPTIMLTDAGGKPYARTGYRPGGPEKYIAHLAEKRAAKTVRDESFAAAEKAKGDSEKAKLLDKALSMIEKTGGVPVISFYGDVVARIIQLDSDNKAGLKSKYGARLVLEDLDKKLRAGKFAEIIKGADDYLAKEGSTKEIKQEVVYKKSFALYRMKNLQGAIAALEVARALAPNTSIGKQIPNILKGLKAQAEKQAGETTPEPAKPKKSE